MGVKRSKTCNNEDKFSLNSVQICFSRLELCYIDRLLSIHVYGYYIKTKDVVIQAAMPHNAIGLPHRPIEIFKTQPTDTNT